ncbi:flagellar assembly protein FliH [Thalassotalea eurytherma]|uniref:Flagellar assembly protein FliH n=1 Tax=Thalassotalea eurytherma TaxID=1144278 RepID=A0ABQ6H6Q7_9GAMM|nr:flagellar assembly protein FliH [Thalassotalea eurytherma]GLX83149.1 flagellar assembly protein FliH [Thalassotalea eurytherma]
MTKVTQKPSTRQILTNEEATTWGVPNVAVEVDESEKNALGLRKNWRYEPPEDNQEEEVAPLTAEDIEEIRKAAYEEGFSQGKEEGFASGYEEGKAQGHQEGVVSGNEEGLAQGLSQGEEQINQLANNWSLLVEELNEPMAKVTTNVEHQLLELVVQLTKAVTLQEGTINPDIIYQAIDKGMKALPSQESQTQIYLNPIDLKLVEAQFGGEFLQDKGWRLLPAPHIEQGGCQIENATSNIDLTLKARLKEVLDSFLQEALYQ